jgi:hypothetical protein
MVISPGRRSSGRPPGVTALGLVARPRPTHHAGGHGPAGAAWRSSSALPDGRSCRARAGLAGDPKARRRRVVDHGSLPGRQVAPAAPSACALTWVAGLLVGLAGRPAAPPGGPAAAFTGQRPSSVGGLDRSGRRLLAEVGGQLADLGFWVAAMAAERLQERELALLGPSGTRSWATRTGCRPPRRSAGSRDSRLWRCLGAWLPAPIKSTRLEANRGFIQALEPQPPIGAAGERHDVVLVARDQLPRPRLVIGERLQVPVGHPR